VTERRPRPPHTRIGVRAGAVLATVAVAVLAGSALELVSVDRVVYQPGPVYDTLGEIGEERRIVSLDEDLQTYPTEGHLWFTTIHLDGGPGDDLSAWEWLRAELDPAATVVPREDVFPEDVTAEQVREQNTELMEHSQQDAAVVALRANGIDIPEDIVVAQVIVDAPADGVLHVDDQILRIDGEPMADARAVQDRLQEVEPGTSVPMTLLRDEEELTIEVPTTQDEDSGRTIVGVYLAPRYDLPYEVSIDAGNVGGPSAGLMFSLAVYDQVTPGALTGGRSIAGTGTISGSGVVGGIGGITQKMYAAREAGASLFLAPSENCSEVVDAAPRGLEVAAVSTFDEAVEVLELAAAADDLTSEALPTCERVLEDGAGSTG
jgi:PDZ domain-containing protein